MRQKIWIKGHVREIWVEKVNTQTLTNLGMGQPHDKYLGNSENFGKQ